MKGGDKGGGEISIFFESSIYITTVSQFFLKTDFGLKIYPGQRKRKSHAKAASKHLRDGKSQPECGLRGGVNCLVNRPPGNMAGAL
jgi:hypothetical protein